MYIFNIKVLEQYYCIKYLISFNFQTNMIKKLLKNSKTFERLHIFKDEY